MNVKIYVDYTCPYVYRASLWVATLLAQGVDLDPDWRFFSLTQVNNKQAGWSVWEEPLNDPAGWGRQRRLRGLRAQWAAAAARLQGKEAFLRYHLALLRAIHEQGMSLESDEATHHAARVAELDFARWQEASREPTGLEQLRREHEEAVGRGIFGTPTFLFEGAEPAYLKLQEIPGEAEVGAYWQSFQQAVVHLPHLLEIKRPH